ncbi:unnamed protein product [Amaranthus hypochondriacus]
MQVRAKAFLLTCIVQEGEVDEIMKEDQQTQQLNYGKQQTLGATFRVNACTFEDPQSSFGIFTHGPCYYGSRSFLTIKEDPPKEGLKVTHWTKTHDKLDSSKPADQGTLRASLTANPIELGDTKGSFGISTLGTCYYDPRSFITITGKPQKVVLKVACLTDLLSEFGVLIFLFLCIKNLHMLARDYF